MADDTPQTEAPKTDRAERIKGKIAASQARTRGQAQPRRTKAAASTAEKAKPRTRRAPRDNRGFVDKALDEHPLALLAGSMVLGAIAASLFPAAWGRKIGGRMLGLAAVAGELGSIYGNKALGAAADSARAGQEKLDELGDTLAEEGADARRRAIELGALAGKRALELAGSAARSARDASGSAAKAIGDLTDRVRH